MQRSLYSNGPNKPDRRAYFKLKVKMWEDIVISYSFLKKEESA